MTVRSWVVKWAASWVLRLSGVAPTNERKGNAMTRCERVQLDHTQSVGPQPAPAELDESGAGLAAEERTSWDTHGYIHVRSLLTPEQAALLRALVERTVQSHESAAGRDALDDNGRGHTLRLRNAIAHSPVLDPLLASDPLWRLLTGLLGPHPGLLGTEMFLRRAGNEPLVKFHTDGGPSLQRIRLAAGSLALQMKVQVFLTDVSVPDSGNFVLVPGSHQVLLSKVTPGCFVPEANTYLARSQYPPGAVQVLARPGDALAFPWSLWHAVAPNRHGSDRVSVILRFGQLWCAPQDYIVQPPEVVERLPERVRRMLGYLGGGPQAGRLEGNDLYKPGEVPVPG